jgi:putative addiction module component (TIGR02574 family)
VSDASKSILDTALALSSEERAELAEKLLESFEADDEQVDSAQIDAAWGREAQRRMADYRAGKIGSVPIEEIFGMLWTKYAPPTGILKKEVKE